MIVKLSWIDVNAIGNGFRVYRDEDPLDIENLPAPIVTLPPVSGPPPQPVDWVDDTAVEGRRYYYIVSTFFGGSEKLTDAMSIIASPAPSYIGEFFQGGFYIGNIAVGSDTYAIIMAPQEGNSIRQWKTANTATAGTDSIVDGWENTLAMTASEALTLAHPAAAYCRSYDGGGFDDWYLPAKNEIYLSFTYRALLTELGLEAQNYWSSTQASAYNAWCLQPVSGSQSTNFKSTSYRVRPVRRLKLMI